MNEGTLRQLAADALDERRQRIREEDEKRDREAGHALGMLLTRNLGMDIKKMPTRGSALYEGLEFTVRPVYGEFTNRRTLHLVKACGICRKPRLSTEIENLADLGEMLENFVESYPSHECRGEMP